MQAGATNSARGCWQSLGPVYNAECRIGRSKGRLRPLIFDGSGDHALGGLAVLIHDLGSLGLLDMPEHFLVPVDEHAG